MHAVKCCVPTSIHPCAPSHPVMGSFISNVTAASVLVHGAGISDTIRARYLSKDPRRVPTDPFTTDVRRYRVSRHRTDTPLPPMGRTVSDLRLCDRVAHRRHNLHTVHLPGYYWSSTLLTSWTLLEVITPHIAADSTRTAEKG